MTDITNLSKIKGVSITALCRELSLPRATYYRGQIKKSDVPGNAISPANVLPDELRQTILDLLHSERFVDCTPYQVYYTLLDGKPLKIPPTLII